MKCSIRLPLGFSTSWRSVYIEILKPSTCCNSGHPAIIFGRTPVHWTHVKNIGRKKFQSPYNSSRKLNKPSMNSNPIWKFRNFHDTSRCYKRQMVECSQTICIWKIHKWMWEMQIQYHAVFFGFQKAHHYNDKHCFKIQCFNHLCRQGVQRK